MKIRFIFLLALMLGFLASNAQYKQFNLGLRAAPHVSWMKPNIDGYSNAGAKMGFGWGFVAEYNFTENHSFGSGFNVVFNGGKLEFNHKEGANTGVMIRNYNLKAIEVPITLKMRTNEMGGLKYYGQIGFGTSFNIGAKATDEFTYPTETGFKTVTTEKYSYDDIFFIRESLILGIGAEYTLSAGTILSGGFAFNNGFTDILRGKNSLNDVKEKGTVNFVELNIAVLF